MGMPVFIEPEEETMTTTFSSNCQLLLMSTGTRSTSPAPALPPRHPHRRLAPQVQSNQQSAPRQSYFQYHYQQQQQHDSEPQALHRQQHQIQRHVEVTSATTTTTTAPRTLTPPEIVNQVQTSAPVVAPTIVSRPSALFSFYAQQQQQRRSQEQQASSQTQPQPQPQTQPQPQPQPQMVQPRPQPQQQPQPQQPQQQTRRAPSFQELMLANAMQLQASTIQSPVPSSTARPTIDYHSTISSIDSSRGTSPDILHHDNRSSRSSSSSSSDESMEEDDDNERPDDQQEEEREGVDEVENKHQRRMDAEERRRIEFERQMILYERLQRRRQTQLAQEMWRQHRQTQQDTC